MEMAEPEAAQPGRYQIESTLGAGGMGIVYLAQDTRLQRKVAIKKLRHDAASESAHARIQSEAQLLAKLNHPNIVQLYDVLEESDGIALVMEYVEGTTLREWMREHSAPLRDKLGLLTQICRGLSEAHSLGIIHRDLKPDNILITFNGTAKISDFGIAKSQSGERQDITRENHTTGTVSAMSPEQIQGKPLDHRSDLFSLGTIAYELLCDVKPFDYGEGGSLALASRMLNEPHIPPQKALAKIPEPLAVLLDKLLNKNPKERPESAQQVYEALTFLYQQSHDADTQQFSATATALLTRQASPRTTSIKWFVASALVLILGSISGYWLWQKIISQQQILAVIPVEFSGRVLPNASQEKIEAVILDAIRENIFTRNRLHLSPANRTSGVDFKDYQAYLRASGATQLVQPIITCEEMSCDALVRFIDQNGLIRAETQRKFLPSDIVDLRSILDHSFNDAFQKYDIFETSAAPMEVQDQESYLSLFHKAYLQYSATQADIEAIQKLLTKYPDQPKIFKLLTDVLLTKYHLERDTAYLEQTKQTLILANSRINNTSLLAKMWANLGVYDQALDFNWLVSQLQDAGETRQNIAYIKAKKYMQLGELVTALNEVETGLAYSRDTASLQLKADILMQQGRYKEASTTLQELLNLAPDDFKALNLYGPISLYAGKVDEGVMAFERLLEKSPNHQLYNNLGLGYLLQDAPYKAREAFNKSLELSPNLGNALINLADLELARFSRDRAFSLYRQYLSKHGLKRDLDNLIFQSQAHAVLGKKKDAVRALQDAIKRVGNSPFDNYNIALTQLRLQDGTAAIISLEVALENGLSPVWLKLPAYDDLCRIKDIESVVTKDHLNCESRQHKN